MTPQRGGRPVPTEPSGVADLVRAYRTDPGADELRRLQAAVRGLAGFDPGLAPRPLLAPLAADPAALAVAARRLLPGAFLSPYVHATLARALRALGRTDDAQREAAWARLALRSVLDSGDGSRERPWRVIRVSDELDVLRHDHFRSVTQALVEGTGTRLDRHVDAAGDERWFDVTPIVPAGRA